MTSVWAHGSRELAASFAQPGLDLWTNKTGLWNAAKRALVHQGNECLPTGLSNYLA